MKIFVECKPDRLLARHLFADASTDIVHLGGKPGVCKQLRRSREAIGLMDEDPLSNQPKYFRELERQVRDPSSGIEMLLDRERNNAAFLLCPRLEEWILEVAEKAGVGPGEHGLPGDGAELHKIINKNLDRFADFLEAVAGSASFLAVKEAFSERGGVRRGER